MKMACNVLDTTAAIFSMATVLQSRDLPLFREALHELIGKLSSLFYRTAEILGSGLAAKVKLRGKKTEKERRRNSGSHLLSDRCRKLPGFFPPRFLKGKRATEAGVLTYEGNES